MDTLNVKSTLSDEEIVKNFEGIDFFSEIMSGLEEALAFEKGKTKAATLVRKRSLPEVNTREIRKSMNMTQRDFAGLIGVSTRTVEAWETGKSNPSPTARNLLYLILKNPELVSQLLNR